MIGALFHRVFSKRSKISAELILAAEDGDHKKVKRLLTVADPEALGSRALLVACQKGHLECVKLLLPLASLEDSQSVGKQLAEHGTSPEALALLVNHDPKFAPMLLVHAVTGKNLKAVTVLSELTDPKYKDSLALQWAVVTGQEDIVDVLFDVSDPKAALFCIQKQHTDSPQHLAWFYDRVMENQNQKILSEIGGHVNGLSLERPKRKM